MKTIKRTSAIILALCIIATVFTACSLPFGSQAKKLLGAWRDNTGTAGFEFLKDNSVNITYADITLPIIGRWNGTVTGTYTIEKDDQGKEFVKINFTVLAQTISKSYYFKVDGNALTLTDLEDGSETVYTAYTESAAGASSAQ